MTQIFIFGSSNAYGVGGSEGGWGDMLKRHLHTKMYGKDGIGEVYEVYNFAKPGATAEFVKRTFEQQLKDYRKPGKVIAILSVGGNNAKAENSPDNFVSSLDDFKTLMADLLRAMAEAFDQLIVNGFGPYDESKTLPKPNPLTGGQSYFWNDRSETFCMALRQLCHDQKIDFIERPVSAEDWIKRYLYQDGLHANDKGYEAIFQKILTKIDP